MTDAGVDAMELTHLKCDLGAVIAHGDDRVAIIDLGEVTAPTRFQFLGVHPILPKQGPTIV